MAEARFPVFLMLPMNGRSGSARHDNETNLFRIQVAQNEHLPMYQIFSDFTPKEVG